MSAHKIRISAGNRKMGGIPSVSLPPIKSCARGIPCALLCYVIVNMLGGPYGKAIGKSYQANYDFLRADPDRFFADLGRYLARKSPALFRFHVSGDFISADHLKRAIQIARDFPQIRFLAFSKNHAIFPHPRAIPGNFTLIASLWGGWGERPQGYRAAFMRDPANPDPRIPRSAIHCGGNCESCGMCWDLRKLRRDVYFDQH